ncbi:MAG: glycosyltransferase family 39 protein [Anaerolineae bacterium]
MSRKQEWVLVTLVMLIAGALRLWELGDVPPGLSHDEVINGLVARDILRGAPAIYFTEATVQASSSVSTGGHEPLYHYAQGATVGLFGENWLGLRWPSFAFGLLGIAATYILVRRLFDSAVALLTIAWLSGSFWPLFYARVGLRAILLPVVSALTIYFLFRAIRPHPDLGLDQPHHLFSGLFLGLSLYTYMAARFLPFTLAAFLVYLSCVTQFSLPWSKLLRLFLSAALIAAPLLMWLATHRSAEHRVSEVREPLDRLLAGDPSLVWHNLVANLGFFAFTGDPWPHQGIPGRPIFADPASAALFCVGALIAIWRWRNPRYGFLLIWLVGALAPSILTSHAPPHAVSDAPSSIRDILGLTVVSVFPALALVEAGRWIKQHLPKHRFLPRDSYLLVLAVLVLSPCLLLTVRDYFVRWARRQDVRFFYQTGLTAVGQRLDELVPEASVVVAGLSPDLMDRPTLEFSSEAGTENVRFCDARQTLIIPADRESEILVPEVVPFDDQKDLQRRLETWSKVETYPSFASYRLQDGAPLDRHLQRLETNITLPDGTPIMLPVSFTGRLAFLGYEWAEKPSTPEGSVSLLTYWRVQTPPANRIKIFVHLLDDTRNLVAQHDGLASPPQGWTSGDLIVQKHTFSLPDRLPPGQYPLQVGVYYDSARGERLNALTADSLLLYSLEIR